MKICVFFFIKYQEKNDPNNQKHLEEITTAQTGLFLRKNLFFIFNSEERVSILNNDAILLKENQKGFLS